NRPAACFARRPMATASSLSTAAFLWACIPLISAYLEEDQVIAMNDLIVDLVAQNLFNPTCMQSFNLIQLLRAVIHQPACELAALQVQAANTVADAERPFNLSQPRRKQTLPSFHQCLARARVDNDITGRV